MNGGVCLSLNNGSNWTALNIGITSSCIQALVICGNNIFAGNFYSAVLKRPLIFSISGYFNYDNTPNTPLDSVKVNLMHNGIKIDSTQTDINGFYQFNGVENGLYNIIATTHKPWNGVNGTDAVKVRRHFLGSELFTSSIKLHAADVDMTFGINSTDAMKIMRRFAGTDTSFIRGDWLFAKPLGGDTINVSVYNNDTVIVNGSNVTQNFKGLCVGDVNGSYYPLSGAKSNSKVFIEYEDKVKLNSNESFVLPVKSSQALKVGAISLILNFPNHLLQIAKVQLSNINETSSFYYSIWGDELRMGWVETNEALLLNHDDTLLTINLKTLPNFKPGDIIKFEVENNQLCEFANEDGSPLDSVILKTNTIEHINSQGVQNPTGTLNSEIIIYPNPSNEKLSIRNLSGNTKAEIYSIDGKLLKIVFLTNTYEINISDLTDGFYILKLQTGKEAAKFIKFVRL